METPSRASWMSILLLGFIWGSTFMIVAVALRGYPPITVAAARTTFAAITLALVMLVLRLPLLPKRLQPNIAMIGILSTALPFSLLSWGQQYVTSAFAGATMIMVPLFLLPLAHIFTDDKLTPRRTIGMIIGFVGAFLLIDPTELDGTLLGKLACLAATFSYAISSVMVRRLPQVNDVSLSTTSLLYGSAVLLPLMLLIDGMPAFGGTLPTLAIVALGLFPTALATLLRVKVVRDAGPVFMTLVNYQVPLWSAAMGALILREPLPTMFWPALAVIMIGVIISQWGQLSKVFRAIKSR